jgi:hypothetical protein
MLTNKIIVTPYTPTVPHSNSRFTTTYRYGYRDKSLRPPPIRVPLVTVVSPYHDDRPRRGTRAPFFSLPQEINPKSVCSLSIIFLLSCPLLLPAAAAAAAAAAALPCVNVGLCFRSRQFSCRPSTLIHVRICLVSPSQNQAFA